MRKFLTLMTFWVLTNCSCNITGDCKNYIASQIVSPNRKFKIVKFDRNCGATTGNAVRLSVLKIRDSLPEDEGGNIFIADSTVGDIYRDTVVKIAWIDNSTILVSQSRRLRIFKKDSAIMGIKIIYQVSQAQDIPEKYADVSERIAAINGNRSLYKVKLNNEQWLAQTMDGGAELTGYYKGTQIQKITRWIGYSYGNEQFDYYFTGGKLFFIYEVLNAFYVDDSSQVRFDSTFVNFVGRYYFRNNKLYDSETTGHNRFDGEVEDMEGTLLAEMRDCFRILEKKRKK